MLFVCVHFEYCSVLLDNIVSTGWIRIFGVHSALLCNWKYHCSRYALGNQKSLAVVAGYLGLKITMVLGAFTYGMLLSVVNTKISWLLIVFSILNGFGAAFLVFDILNYRYL